MPHHHRSYTPSTPDGECSATAGRVPRSTALIRGALGLAVAATMMAATPPGTAAAPLPAAQASSVWTPSTSTGTYSTNRKAAQPRLRGAVGLSRSSFPRSSVLRVNDRGPRGRIVVASLTGDVESTLTLGGRRVSSAAGIATGRGHQLWVADNPARRGASKRLSLLRITEPGRRAGGTRKVRSTRYTLEYPQAAQRAVAVMVNPRSGRVLIVAKGPKKASVYAVAKSLSTRRVNTLRRVAAAPRAVTAATFAPNGRSVALGTPRRAHLYASLAGRSRALRLPARADGRTLAFNRKGNRLLVVSKNADRRVIGFSTRRGKKAATSTAGSRPSSKAGSLAPGKSAYAVPSGAVFVSPAGNDSATGSASSPVRTIKRAVSLAPVGGTVVLRAGVHHENVAIYKSVTVQSYPGEAVWLDGTSPVTGWAKSGSAWVKSGWTHRFDSSPSFTKGGSDGTSAGWRFLNPAYPMAAHPDQVYVDGAPLQQVASRDKVSPGTFYLDEAASELYIGTDPTGRQVRAADLPKAISVRAENVVLRGFGVRRYATSLPLMGMVTVERPGATVENLVVQDSASTGLGIYDRGARVNRVTSRRNGLMGIGANTAYGLKILSSLVAGNNTERFNMSPAAGGVKIAKARGLEVRNSRITANRGTGLWFDQSNYDATVVGNEMSDNLNHGLFYEISSTGVFADNVVLRNKGFGFKINNSDNLEIWNNTFVGNDRPINLVQDRRRNDGSSLEGTDRQRPVPDPTVPWVLRDIRVHNNVIRQGSGNCLVCVEDYSGQATAAQMALSFRGNVYNRPDGSPAWFAVWSRGANNPATFTTLSAFRNATQQDAGSVLYDDQTTVASGGSIPDKVRSAVSPAPLTSPVSRAVGRKAGTARAGAWLGR